MLFGVAASDAGEVSGAAAAPTRTIYFTNWLERSPNGWGWLPMTFRITSIAVTPRRWTVRAVVVNRSRLTIRIRSKAQAPYALSRYHDFGIADPGPPCDPQPYEPPCGYVERTATVFDPRPFNRRLRPGETWSGTFGGYGPLRERIPYLIRFGVFVPERGTPFSWLTQRSFRLR